MRVREKQERDSATWLLSSLATNGVEEKENDSLKFLFSFCFFWREKKERVVDWCKKRECIVFFLKEGTRFVQRRGAEPWFLTFVFLLA